MTSRYDRTPTGLTDSEGRGKKSQYCREGNPRRVPCVSFWNTINHFRGNQRSCSSEKSRLMFFVLDCWRRNIAKTILRLCFLLDHAFGHAQLFFLERSLALRCTLWTLHGFHQTPGGESSRSPKLGIYQHLSSGRTFFLEINVPWHLRSESQERYGLEVESRSLLRSYRSYKIPPCFSKRWGKCRSFHQLLGSSR